MVIMMLVFFEFDEGDRREHSKKLVKKNKKQTW